MRFRPAFPLHLARLSIKVPIDIACLAHLLQAAPPSPGAALTLAAGMQGSGSRKSEAAAVSAEPELPAVSQRQAVVVQAPAATQPQV